MKTMKRSIRELNSARTQYNPLRGITIQRVVTYLEQGELGNYTELQWLNRMVEKRDAVLRALVRRRAAALLKLDWDIKVIPDDDLPPGATAEMAEAQRIELRKLYDGIKNLKKAIKALALAEFRGYTHLEKNFNGRTASAPDQIDELAFIKQWYWTRDGFEGEWKFDPSLRGSWRGAEDVDLSTLIIREVEDPVDEIGLVAFLRKNMSQKDWDAFVEVFGIPDIFFIMPQGLTKDQQEAWQAEADRMAGDGRGGLPFGSDVKAVGGDVRGTNPFKEHLEYQDTMMVLAGTGGKLTMLSDPTGIGQGATDAHEDAFNELAQAEAAEISEILQESLDAPLLESRFPGQPRLAYFEIAAKDEEDVSALIDNALKLYQAGIEIDVDDLAERTGYSLKRIQKILETGNKKATEEEEIKKDVVEEPPTKTKNRSLWSRLFNRKDETEELKKGAREAIAQAIELDLRPVAISIAEIMDENDDEHLLDAFRQFYEHRFHDLLVSVLEDPSSAEEFEAMLAPSFLNGYAEGEK